MFRRQIPDRVNPRDVLPSRHTIFIRGLSGSTDVGKVEEYFSAETNSRCSVDFFSTSEDKRLSVAIRFKTHDLAKDMLAKYNNKVLLGFPVEISWFKDFRKARARLFEKQRQSGGRQFQRMGFRNNFRANDRRVMAVSPTSFVGDRHARAGSSSSGCSPGNRGRRNFSRSRSRSFSGSTSRSISNSDRSISVSPRSRRFSSQNPVENLRSSQLVPDNQLTNSGNRRGLRNQSYRSVSGSSSSSRSSPGAQVCHNISNTHPPNTSQTYQHTRSPLNYGSVHRDKRTSDPNIQSYSSFANSPAPDFDGGSSVVSGLIQLKRRNKPEPQQDAHRRHRSVRSSSSEQSGVSPHETANLASSTTRLGKPAPSVSPTFGVMTQLSCKQRPAMPNPSVSDLGDVSVIPKRKRQKRIDRSPNLGIGSYAEPVNPLDLEESTVHQSTLATNTKVIPRHGKRGIPKAGRSFTDESFSSEDIGDIPARHAMCTSPRTFDWLSSRDSHDLGGQSRSSHRGIDKSRKTVETVEGSSLELSADVEANMVVESFRKDKRRDDTVSLFKAENVIHETKSDETFDLIRQHKETLAQDYKRDCEAFTSVVRTLISKHAELEFRLMPMLKDILHERGQRCIEELRSFIANHQPESDMKESVVEALTA